MRGNDTVGGPLPRDPHQGPYPVCREKTPWGQATASSTVNPTVRSVIARVMRGREHPLETLDRKTATIPSKTRSEARWNLPLLDGGRAAAGRRTVMGVKVRDRRAETPMAMLRSAVIQTELRNTGR